jgi:hypothetical protein
MRVTLWAACVNAACVLSLGLGCHASLAQTTAAAASARPQLSVAPTPTVAHPSPGTPQVRWSTGDGSPGDVTVSSNRMKETLFGYGAEGSSAAPWISAGQVYVLKLYSIGLGRRLLARLTVGRGEPLDVVAFAPVPQPTSAAVNRLLQLLSFGWIAMLAVLGSLYARDLRCRG